MKAAAYYLATGMIILAASILFDCNRKKTLDEQEVFHRIENIKAKLELQDSCCAEHINSVRSRIESIEDTALYNSVIDDLDEALYYVQEGDEVWVDLDALQSELL